MCVRQVYSASLAAELLKVHCLKSVLQSFSYDPDSYALTVVGNFTADEAVMRCNKVAGMGVV